MEGFPVEYQAKGTLPPDPAKALSKYQLGLSRNMPFFQVGKRSHSRKL
jgi:hypothetical protein